MCIRDRAYTRDRRNETLNAFKRCLVRYLNVRFLYDSIGTIKLKQRTEAMHTIIKMFEFLKEISQLWYYTYNDERMYK